MNKIFAIGLKDLRLILRDPAALILMLLAPYLITLGLGFVSGAFSDDGSSGIQDIPVMIINQDQDNLGGQLIEVFQSDDLADLIDVIPATSVADGRTQVDEDELAALIIIPANFSDIMIPDPSTGETAEGEALELYRSPARPISASVVEAVVTQFMGQVDQGTTLVTVSIEQLVESGQFDLNTIQDQATELVTSQSTADPLIGLSVNSGTAESSENEFNALAVLAPGMALFFLMYTVTLGGSSILRERTEGTLDRMQTTPTSSGQILGGKIFGIFLTGVAQVGILVIGSSFMYNIVWGDWLGVIALIISAALAATSWGLLIAGLARTPEQVTGIGTAVMLTFGAISDTFVDIDVPALNAIGAITPNQWALQGFTKLGLGQTMVDILPNIGALWLMAMVIFTLAVFSFRRKGV